jgi:uncharacterized protein (DUF2252 family)
LLLEKRFPSAKADEDIKATEMAESRIFFIRGLNELKLEIIVSYY